MKINDLEHLLADVEPEKECKGEKRVKWAFRKHLCRYDWKRGNECPYMNKNLLAYDMNHTARYECTYNSIDK